MVESLLVLHQSLHHIGRHNNTHKDIHTGVEGVVSKIWLEFLFFFFKSNSHGTSVQRGTSLLWMIKQEELSPVGDPGLVSDHVNTPHLRGHRFTTLGFGSGLVHCFVHPLLDPLRGIL